jgi:hypothetical protein
MRPMRGRDWSNGWFGVALIALGMLFLVQNYLGYELRNWWALFILIPAIGSFAPRTRSGASTAAQRQPQVR